MSENKDIHERLTKVETIVQYHEQRMSKLEGNLNDLGHKMQEVIINQNALLEKFNTLASSIETLQTSLTMRGVKWFLEKMALPIAIAIAVSMILRFF